MKYFIIVKKVENKLVAVERMDVLSGNMLSAYQVRGAAQNFANKVGGEVYSVQGLDLGKLGTSDAKHSDVLDAAVMQFGLGKELAA